MSTQIWTIFVVQKRFELLGCKTQSFEERRQERVPTGPQSFIGRGRFQPVYGIEESAGQRSRKLCYRGRFDVCADTYNVKDLDEQLKLAQKLVDVVDRANRKICLTMHRYNVDKPDIYYAQVRLLARKEEDERFLQVVDVKYKSDGFFYLRDVMNSVYDKVFTNQLICIVF